MGLLRQMVGCGLCDTETARGVIDHPLFEKTGTVFMRPMARRPDAGAADDDHGDDLIEEYDYDTDPGWMIGLSPRFGLRHLTLNQRMGLLAAADESLWREVLAAARQVYVSPHIRGGSKGLQPAVRLLAACGGEHVGLRRGRSAAGVSAFVRERDSFRERRASRTGRITDVHRAV
ncbi:hypothetical protein [Bifidobacterium parmae]|uniref:hypothetical protein n=1 Tax=Bifidobacterium parmae TaxID=361854 RepID=UPI000C78A8A0|nr:hypothetical protein [Bifidobacterium parmae]